MTTAEKLVRLRKEKGLSQLQLAEEINVSRQAISRWEVGLAVPSREKLRALSELYNVSVDYLLSDKTAEDMQKVSKTEDEAIYISGLLNSATLWDAISDFQPEGGFGKRHIHALPYKIIPAFDPDDDAQREVIEATKALMEEWKVVCESGQYKNLLGPNSGTLPSRRRKQQSRIRELASYGRYAAACAGVLR